MSGYITFEERLEIESMIFQRCSFGEIAKKSGLKPVRFHDLRHSCASLRLANGVPMKMIQDWLGHSDMSTTANIYSHLNAVTKADTGAAMSKALG